MDIKNPKNFELKVDNVLVFAVISMLVVGRVAREIIKKA